jgi:polar amino acid transport system permease protein
MSASEALPLLWGWTPYLLGGFVWNIIVSLASMGVGTVLGGLLALGRAGSRHGVRRSCEILTHICRNVPTFVFLYYLAFLLPFEVEIGGQLVTIPPWIKASLALAIAVVGFVSDNLLAAVLAHRRGDHATAHLFVPNWTMYFVIIVMASSTASVIGVPELVARSNTVIGALNDDRVMIWVYGYAMLWFFLFCMPLTLIMRQVRARVATRLQVSSAA